MEGPSEVNGARGSYCWPLFVYWGGEPLLESTYERLECWPDDGLHGRRVVYTSTKQITPENVIEVVGKALTVHMQNAREIQYLYDYYRGRQDIRLKEKVVRPEINNKVMVNRANEIVTFKTAYLLGEPLQYVSAGGDDDVSEKVNRLNEFMRAENKDSKDKEIADWMHICGIAVRMVLQDEEGEEEGSPVSIYTLDPRDAFVIYHSGVGHKRLAGVLRQWDEENKPYLCVYTQDKYYEIKGDKVTLDKARTVPYIPIIEYVNNEARMGAFEVVLPLLNAINTVESNRVDSIQDFVNAFDVFQNCEIQDDQYSQLSAGGKAINIRSQPGLDAQVYRISSELNQTNTQTLVDDMYDTALTICGMPNRNGGSSTSDTGTAVIYRDGFAEAESRAKDSEKTWIRSERDFLRIVLFICRNRADLNLRLSDIKPEFTRKNLSNVQSKVQVLCEMLNNSKIHPKLAFQYSGVFSDAEEAYRISQSYYDEQQAELTRSLRDEINANNGTSVVSANRPSGRTAESASGQTV